MRVDIVIIGGGIAGLSAAARLCRDGSVLVLEAEAVLGHHASGRSAAMFLPGYGNAVIRELNAASALTHHAMNVLAPRNLMVVAPPAKREAFTRELARTALEEIAAEEAIARVPILDRTWCTSAALAEAWDLDADRCLQNFRRTALSGGARIETGARVGAIERAGDVWNVVWPGGAASADIVVNAAGAWADTVAGMAGIPGLGLVPHRRSIALFAAPDGHDVSGWPFLEELGEAWYAKPDAGRWLVSPADADPVEPFDAWADDVVLAEGLARYQCAVTAAVTRPLTSWAGLRTFAQDRSPVVGRDPRSPSFWWFAGQGGYGFQIAPALAELLGDQMSGRQSDLASALDPARLLR